MFYEVFIPSNDNDGFDVTITVEADNWMTALRSGLERTGEGADAIRNVMCDIKDDNSIHVTDATSRRVFVLKEVGEDGEESAPKATNGAQPTEPPSEADNAPTQKMSALPSHMPKAGRDSGAHSPPPKGVSPPPRSGEFERTPTAKSHQPGADPKAGKQKTAPPPATVKPPARATPPAGTQPPPGGPPSKPAAEKKPSKPAAEKKPPKPAAEQKPSTPKPAPPPEKSAPPAKPAASAPSKPEPEPELPEIEEEQGLASEKSWTSEDGRMRIGSSTFESLQRDEPQPKVVRETRAPSGTRKAVEIGRADEGVSQNTLEEVFLEVQQIHEQGMSMEEVINFVMDLSMEKINAEAGSVMFADVNGRELYFATARGPKAHAVMDFRVPMTKGIVGFCARQGVSLAISDAEKDPRFYKDISEALGYETRNLCCAPIQFEGRVYGALELMNKDVPFSNTEVNVLTYIGRQLAKFVHDLIMAREKLE